MRKYAIPLALAAVCLAGSVVYAVTTHRPAAQLTYSDSGPEAQLSRILDEIESNRLDRALERTESLLRQYPNFRLAHLIKGDLLLARGMPLATFGNARNASRESVNDLRDEIIVHACRTA